MKKTNENIDRRGFFHQSAFLTTGLVLDPFSDPTLKGTEDSDSIYMIGPQPGYSPRIGTLLSTMTMMRAWVVRTVEGLTTEQLDFQIDDQSNSIGAMLLHLAAVERFYQLNTFDEMEWGTWDDSIKKRWNVAARLGENARDEIKGNDLQYYLSALEEVRERTKMEFAKRDDDWLMKSEPFFESKATNNHCKWFHVCEHESNHNGQMKFIKKRLP